MPEQTSIAPCKNSGGYFYLYIPIRHTIFTSVINYDGFYPNENHLMAAFLPTFTVTQSADGETLTFTDTSPYGLDLNDEDYLIGQFTTREFILTDVYGVTLDTLVLTGGALTATYTLTTDTWVNTELSLAGVATYSEIQREGFNRLGVLKYQEATLQGCCDKTSSNNLIQADIFITRAEHAEPLVDGGVTWQESWDTANYYLDLETAA